MATRDIDPFEIGRRSLVIPFREFPIWLACAVWPFAVVAAAAVADLKSIDVSPLAVKAAGWGADAIFDWCWMTALCRSTVLQLVTFPAARRFWLFVLLSLGLSAVSWIFSALFAIAAGAAFIGDIPFVEISGPLAQLIGIIVGFVLAFGGIWVGLRLMIWPAHCVATGRLVSPRIIWRGMQDHSFDGLIMVLITAGPALLLMIAEFIAARTFGAFTHLSSIALIATRTVAAAYTNGAFDAAMLIAYYALFAPEER